MANTVKEQGRTGSLVAAVASVVGAIATLFAAAAVIGAVVVALLLLDEVAASSSTSVDDRQLVCVQYADFVLRQHDAGLGADQIERVVDGMYPRDGAVDVVTGCGSPASVIAATR